ncbi:hypothetical protein [Miniphocaeibacter massiliensis]|uniref:hypothetical protein n=1 Tax=Miniphocaeibacter massiliensis TaxID=2041841 RepID=UPI000C1C117B|nr:hypothetical protein [Miniphocaeibacter massiliensis]
MEYRMKIDKYVKDRFKIYKKDSEEVVYLGEKTGNVASYFDSFIGETYSKGAEFIFYNDNREKQFTIERNFYDKDKNYKIIGKDKQIGEINSRVNGDYIEIDISYNNEKLHISLNREEYKLIIPRLGKIESKKQGFRNYEELEIIVKNERDNLLLIAVAVYIWDVFMKNKLAFVFKK